MADVRPFPSSKLPHGQDLPAEQMFHGLFHIFVPQAVDDWIQKRDHQGIKQRNHLVLILWSILVPWLGIHEDSSAIEEAQSSQVGRASGEGLLSSLSRVAPEDIPQDPEIRNRDGGDGYYGNGSCGNKKDYFRKLSVRARELQDGRDITEEVVDTVWPTIGQPESSTSLDDGTH